jgi:hypothetical protein
MPRNCSDFSTLSDIRDQIKTSELDSRCESEERNRRPAIQMTTGRHRCLTPAFEDDTTLGPMDSDKFSTTVRDANPNKVSNASN